jgi:large subunit ribosomal protein L9
LRADAEALRERIEALVFEARRQASEEGRLFGSVTAQDVVEFLATQGVTVERRRVVLEEPIKTLGETTVTVRLHPEVTARLRVRVVRD